MAGVRDKVREFALSLPEAFQDHPWGEDVVKVRGKIFVFLGGSASRRITVKLEESHAHALSIEGAEPAGYGLGASGWVTVPLRADGISIALLRDWVEESHRIVAPKRLAARLDVSNHPTGSNDPNRAVAERLEALIAAGNMKVRDKLEDVLDKVESALRKLGRSRPDRQGAAGDLEGAAGDLQAAVKSKLVTAAEGNALLREIAQIVRLLAVDAIEEAKAGGGEADKIAEAERLLARGDTRLAAGKFKDAVAAYKDALSKAEGA